MRILRCFAIVAVLWLLCSATVPAQTVTVRVRLIYLKDGKPANDQKVMLYEGDPQSMSAEEWRSGSKELTATTSSNGVAVFQIMDPLPKTVWVYEENGRITGCAWEEPIPLDQVMKQGVTIGADARYGGSCKGDRSAIKRLAAKPGEIVMFVRKLSIWEKMQN